MPVPSPRDCASGEHAAARSSLDGCSLSCWPRPVSLKWRFRQPPTPIAPHPRRRTEIPNGDDPKNVAEISTNSSSDIPSAASPENGEPTHRAGEPPIALPIEFPTANGSEIAERFPRLIYTRSQRKPQATLKCSLGTIARTAQCGRSGPAVACRSPISSLPSSLARRSVRESRRAVGGDESGNTSRFGQQRGRRSGFHLDINSPSFPDASLLADPEHEGAGRFLVIFDEREGYQGWIIDGGTGSHTLRLKLAVPLEEGAGITQLKLSPPVATQSELQLDLQGNDIAAEADRNRKVTITPLDEGRSRLAVNDLRNQLTLSWRRGAAIAQQRPPNFDVKGEIRVSVNGPGAVRSQVTLDLQSYSRPIDQFFLRLPPHTTIVSGNQPGLEIVNANETGEASANDTTNTRRPSRCRSPACKRACSSRRKPAIQKARRGRSRWAALKW